MKMNVVREEISGMHFVKCVVGRQCHHSRYRENATNLPKKKNSQLSFGSLSPHLLESRMNKLFSPLTINSMLSIFVYHAFKALEATYIL